MASSQDEEDLLIIDSVEKAKPVAKVLKKNLLIQFNIDIKYSAGLEIVSAIFSIQVGMLLVLFSRKVHVFVAKDSVVANDESSTIKLCIHY